MSEQKRRPIRRGPGAGMVPGEKAKKFKGTVGQLIKYMGRYKIGVLVVLIFAVASTVFSIAGPKILGKATTELFCSGITVPILPSDESGKNPMVSSSAALSLLARTAI